MVGWQERVDMPELGLDQLTAKLDSGAVLSSLHAEDIRILRRKGGDWVRFEVAETMENGSPRLRCESPVVSYKRIQSSSGHRTMRPVIETMLVMAGFHWSIELTLASRPTMQFPLLIGRDALAGRCLVDCGSTFVASHRNG